MLFTEENVLLHALVFSKTIGMLALIDRLH